MALDTGTFLKPRRKRRKTRKAPSQSPGPENIWADAKELIQRGLITPVISNELSDELIFKGQFAERVVEAWAEQISYPWQAKQHLVTIAQFARIRQTGPAARRDYLKHLKYVLLDMAYDDQEMSDSSYEIAEENVDTKEYDFTRMTRDLGYVDFKGEELHNHPFHFLARFPFKIYFTTSYHQFLELALEQQGKSPISEIFPWNQDLERKITSIFSRNPAYEPSEDSPLVYHLCGRDDFPESLVLTENDYLNVLLKLVQDRKMTHTGRHTTDQGAPVIQGIPRRVKDAMSQTPLLLLGYQLHNWDFRVLFRGLLHQRVRTTLDDEGEGICIQYVSDPLKSEEKIQEELDKYLLTKSRLKVFWGEPVACLQELYDQWQGVAVE
jgi:hypothetical protein